MPRLIDADVLMPNAEYKGKYDTVNAYDIVNCPTVDIDAITESHEKIGYDKGFRDGYAQATSEVRPGRWIEREEWFEGEPKPRKTMGCSECGHSMYSKHDTLSYCPNCGAKMQGDKDGNK